MSRALGYKRVRNDGRNEEEDEEDDRGSEKRLCLSEKNDDGEREREDKSENDVQMIDTTDDDLTREISPPSQTEATPPPHITQVPGETIAEDQRPPPPPPPHPLAVYRGGGFDLDDVPQEFAPANSTHTMYDIYQEDLMEFPFRGR